MMGLEIGIGFIASAFFAGLLTFLAPCTLPLVPAYLGFISGVSTKELENPETADIARRKVLFNGIFFILGFSAIFILFGTLAGVIGQELVPFRIWFSRIGGILVILFGLVMLGIIRVRFFQVGGSAMKLPGWLKAGHFSSSFLVGGAFAFGWTPCVGPILASILLLASTEGSALSGALMLTVFSAGLALPFLLISFAISSASKRIASFFAFMKKWRVIIFAFFGLVLGLLANVIVVALGTVTGDAIRTVGEFFLVTAPWLLPVVVSGSMAIWAHKKHDVDVLSVIGGLFLVALGILLATNSFGFLVQFGFQFFSFLGYEGLLEHL